jgi:hypothetical protein
MKSDDSDKYERSSVHLRPSDFNAKDMHANPDKFALMSNDALYDNVHAKKFSNFAPEDHPNQNPESTPESKNPTPTQSNNPFARLGQLNLSRHRIIKTEQTNAAKDAEKETVRTDVAVKKLDNSTGKSSGKTAINVDFVLELPI